MNQEAQNDAAAGKLAAEDPNCGSFIFYTTTHEEKNNINHLLRSPHTIDANFSTTPRPFPDYSPRNPSVVTDTHLIRHVTTTIKRRRLEPLRRVLKPYESRFKPSHLTWVLINIKNDYKLALNFFNWAKSRSHEQQLLHPTLESLCIVVHIAVASNDVGTAKRLVYEFWARPRLDVLKYFELFTERLIYTYKDWGSHPVVFDVYFQVLVETGFVLEAEKLFHKLLGYGLVVSVDSCNLFLSKLSCNFEGIKIAAKDVKEAHNLLVQMEHRGDFPDVVSYGVVVSGYCKFGELDKVLKLVDELKRKGSKPNEYIYNNIIVVYTTLNSGFCKSGDFLAACKLFNEMKHKKIVPDFVTYTSVIHGICKSGKIAEAHEMFNEMFVKGFKPDEVTYTALIDVGYCKAGEMKEAFAVHPRWFRRV
ncbi:pentatricopeptide repeat-containing protein mitochondrial-like [Trifolium pratense]|uniref:Pentatricopeptide repeat-containing protein mitochondrial-like n=1 Tax=Trifolium pratense TaxID=57577 RepID=A0A2K3LWA8_TRIPR|nr:pentatricopeptide repeat-containing protein mitochondrial-like [Trifolium pratense]